MTATLLWLRSNLRSNWRSVALVVTITALCGGAAMATTAGARRTTTAYTRFVRDSREPQVYVFSPDRASADAAAGAMREFADANDVASAVGLAVAPAGMTAAQQVGLGTLGLVGDAGTSIGVPKVIAGHLPLGADDVAVNEILAATLGLAVGDRVPMIGYSPALMQACSDGSVPCASDVDLGDVTVAGILRGVDDISPETFDKMSIYISPPLTAHWLDLVAASSWLALAWVDSSVDRTAMGEAIRTAVGAEHFTGATADSFLELDSRGDPERTSGALDVERNALLIVALLAALSGLIAVPQALTRLRSSTANDHERLRALGQTRRDRRFGVLITAAGIGTAGAAIAIGMAVGASPLFPIGLARRADPSLGVHLDWLVLGIGAVVTIAVVTGAGVAIDVIGKRRLHTSDTGRLARVLTLSHPVPGMAGRLLTDSGRLSQITRTAGASAIAGVAIFAATAVVITSKDALAQRPALFGAPWDLQGSTTSTDPAALAVIASDARVDAAALLHGGRLDVAGKDIGAVGVEQLRGFIEPTLLSGRMVRGDGEIVLSPSIMAALDVAIGDTIEVTHDGTTGTFAIVGKGVPIAVGTYSSDDGAIVTAADFTRFGVPPRVEGEGGTELAVRIRSGQDLGAVRTEMANVTGGFDRLIVDSFRPARIANLERVGAALWMTLAFAGLLTMLVLAHAITSRTSRPGRGPGARDAMRPGPSGRRPARVDVDRGVAPRRCSAGCDRRTNGVATHRRRRGRRRRARVSRTRAGGLGPRVRGRRGRRWPCRRSEHGSEVARRKAEVGMNTDVLAVRRASAEGPAKRSLVADFGVAVCVASLLGSCAAVAFARHEATPSLVVLVGLAVVWSGAGLSIALREHCPAASIVQALGAVAAVGALAWSFELTRALGGVEALLADAGQRLAAGLAPALFFHLLMTLPDRHLTRRGRRMAVIASYIIGGMVGLALLADRRHLVAWPVALLWAASLAALPVAHANYRSAGTTDQRRMQWIGWAAVVATEVALLSMALSLVADWPHHTAQIALAATGLVPLALAAATVPRLLARVDRLLTHTVSLTGLTMLIVIVYALALAAFGRAPNDSERSLLLLSMAAAAGASIAYQPARAWLAERANRVVYGERIAPEEALRTWGSRLTRAIPLDELLLQLVETLRKSMQLQSAQIWTGADGHYEVAAMVPHREAPPFAIGDKERTVVSRAGVSGGTWIDIWLSGVVDPGLTASTRIAPIAHSGELLGLIVCTRAIDSTMFTEEEDQLLTELARQVGLALHNVQLDTALQASLDELRATNDELRASRVRIVAAGDAERRKLERNLHDGAQQHLVALAVKLRLAKDAVVDDPADAEAMIDEIRGNLQEAITELRSLAHGIYPPLLVSGGLAEALPAAAARAALPTTTELSVVRHPQDVEAAVYFCCMEALQNAGKHAGEDATAIMRVWEDDRVLHWEVTDDGPGFDSSGVNDGGHGFVNLRDRMGSFGGTLDVISAPGAGTTIRGQLPLG